jgi:hypothetical protein
MKVIPETALDICTFLLLIIYYSEVNMTDGVCFFTSIYDVQARTQWQTTQRQQSHDQS